MRPAGQPSLQHPLQFEPEVVMKCPGRVFLNDKDETLPLRRRPGFGSGVFSNFRFDS